MRNFMNKRNDVSKILSLFFLRTLNNSENSSEKENEIQKQWKELKYFRFNKK